MVKQAQTVWWNLQELIKAEVDRGNVLLPHRLQPIPHESDVRDMDPENGLFLLEEEFPQVEELDPIHNHDACCDQGKRTLKPGLPPFHEKCGRGKFWYACGFLKQNRDDEQKHARLTTLSSTP